MEAESLIANYRENASYCRVKAARTEYADDRAKWLEFAETWEKLADEIGQESTPSNVTVLKLVSRAKAK